MRPSLVMNMSLHRPEGAGNAGGALHPRSHTQMEKGAHEHTGSAEAPGIPCVMALRLMARSPRRRIRLVTVVGGCKRHFDPVGSKGHRRLGTSNGCQDHTVLPYARNVVRPARLESLTRFNPPCDPFARRRSRVHHIPSRVRDDRETPLLPERDGDLKPLIWGRCEAQSCPSCHCAAVLSLVI